MQNNTVHQVTKNRRNLILLLAVFALPVVVSSMMYFGGWRPSATGNHGELIQPAHYIDDSLMHSIDGKQVKISDLHGKWTMVYFDSASCPEECINRIYFMRQIHRSQGKYLDQIQRVFILTDKNSLDTLKNKLIEYPEMQVLIAENSVISKLSQEFGLNIENGIAERNIYLLDPLGNLMMRYRADVKPEGMRKDMDRLLKYSAESK